MSEPLRADEPAHVAEVWEDEPVRRRSRGKSRFRSGEGVLPQLLVVVAFFAVWEGVVRVTGMRSYLLPAPSAIFAETYNSFSILLSHMWVTLMESVAGFLLAAVVGVGMAMAMVSIPFLRRVIMPGLVAFNAVPKVAFAPLLIIWLGLGIESKVALSFLIAFFPIVVNTTTGMADIEPELLNLTRLMKAKWSQQFVKIRIPHALPAMFDGFKIALPIAIIGAIVAEFVASSQGLGYLIVSAGVSLRTDLVFAAILMIVAFSMVLYWLLVRVESRVLSWRPSAR